MILIFLYFSYVACILFLMISGIRLASNSSKNLPHQYHDASKLQKTKVYLCQRIVTGLNQVETLQLDKEYLDTSFDHSVRFIIK
jgi:hypothetical protein